MIWKLLELAVMTGGIMLALWWAWESFKAIIGVSYEDKED
jgi:hypothetical protein